MHNDTPTRKHFNLFIYTPFPFLGFAPLLWLLNGASSLLGVLLLKMNKWCDNMASGASRQPPCTYMYTHTILTISLSHTCTSHKASNLTHTLCVSYTHTNNYSLCLCLTHTHTHTHTHKFQYKTKTQNRSQLTWWYTRTSKQNASHRK